MCSVLETHVSYLINLRFSNLETYELDKGAGVRYGHHKRNIRKSECIDCHSEQGIKRERPGNRPDQAAYFRYCQRAELSSQPVCQGSESKIHQD